MNKKRLLADLVKDYKKARPKSFDYFQQANKVLVRGGSHNLRLFDPFPFYDERCEGSKITDLDSHTYVDFWQGHFSNILGHNPPVILEALQKYFSEGKGLLTGFPGILQKKLSKLLLSRINADRIRFTTSGTLATMYAIMMSRAYTGKNLVLKIGGGWHGAQPYALKGITTYDHGLNRWESAGIPQEVSATLLTTRFNDPDELEVIMDKNRDQLAGLILEPFIGAGGFIFGTRDYIQKARELTEKHGALLIFDEVISGFRFHAGALHRIYDVTPDLCVLGKIIGGGMPISALAGKTEIMALCDPSASSEKRVKFEGGTFSAHPASMVAGITLINHLIQEEAQIYPRIGEMGDMVRREVEAIFSRHGFNVRCTGDGGSLNIGSSVIGVHFLKTGIDQITSPEEIWNPDVNDFEMREKILRLAMLREGFNIFHGFGTISSAHTEQEVQNSLDAVDRIAKKWAKYR